MCWLRSALGVSAVLMISSCSDGTGPGGNPPLDCSSATVRALAVGEHQIIDPTKSGACVRLPAAAASGAEHLYVPLSTASREETNGVSGPYLVTGQSAAVAVAASTAPLPPPRLSAFQRPLGPDAFHDMLRGRERALSQSSTAALFSQTRTSAVAAGPPLVGDKRTFQVCVTTTCSSFAETSATALSVGQRVAIFVDDSAPSNGYTQADLDDVRGLFDQFLYPIDTTAFGRESDIDGNGVVIVLLTQLVNALSPNCNSTSQVILGYFFGADLLPQGPGNPGSNEAEVFYGLVPDPNPQCDISEAFARSHLPATFIHEFQHMISFNQHVLVRDGASEDTWLNEGLSHFAEELGGRQVPDGECPNSTSCFEEFIVTGDLRNAFEYLAQPDSFFLIEPGNSSGKLEERGANWLFVRWLVDHFATDTILGTDFTRRLVATSTNGGANVEAQTGEDFPRLVGQWQLANYLDDLPGFSEPTSRLRYKSWNLREEAAAEGRSFPLVPVVTNGVDYSKSGVLRAGSGPHIRVVQAAGAPSVDLTATAPTGAALPATLEPRIALVRVR